MIRLTHRSTSRLTTAFLLLAFAAALRAQSALEPIDLDALNQIKYQAFQNSHVMNDVFYIADVYGPRVNGSPNHRASAQWIMDTLKSYGLKNVHLEPWNFGNSWQYTKFYGALVEPNYAPIIGFPLVWTPGTNGPVTAEAIFAPISSEADFAKYKGKLRGKIVFVAPAKEVLLHMTPEAHRLTDEEIQARTMVPNPADLDSTPGLYRAATAVPTAPPEVRAANVRRRNAINQFLHDEGVAVVVTPSLLTGDGGNVIGAQGGSPNPNDPVPPPMVIVTPEHYNRVIRLLQHGFTPKLTFDIETKIYKDDQTSFNVVGEIPGATKPDEVVMLGGHLDSWQGGTGASDNGTGSAVAIEALRILSQLHKPMARTVRVALWGGEEQGLLGSKAYVQQHFAPRDTMKLTPEYSKLDVYFNDDQGSGRFRGVSAYGNSITAEIFKQWIAPIKDLGISVVTSATATATTEPGGTDHTSFLWIGLPGTAFLQDPLNYSSRTHHSNMDVYDRVQPGDVMQGSAVEAWFAYNAATRPEMLPRIPTPLPLKPGN